MIKKHTLKNHKFMLLLLIIFVLVGCGQTPERPNPETQESNSPKVPKVLTELEDQVLQIMYDVDSVTGIEKAMQEQEMKTGQTSQSGGGSQNQGQQTEQQQQQKGQTSGGEQKPEEKVDVQQLIKENKIIIPLLDANEVKGTFSESPTPPEDINKVWTQISDSVTEIHKKWNVLEAQLTPVNVPKEKSEEFEQVLDGLTLSVMNKEKLNSLKLANELTRITTDFRSYFNGPANHTVYGMYYHIRGVILFAASNNYTGAIQHLDEASKLGASVRQDLIKQDAQDVLQKFELSIEDLRKQLQEENFALSQIKAPIVIKNIKLMQDSFETQTNK